MKAIIITTIVFIVAVLLKCVIRDFEFNSFVLNCVAILCLNQLYGIKDILKKDNKK